MEWGGKKAKREKRQEGWKRGGASEREDKDSMRTTTTIPPSLSTDPHGCQHAPVSDSQPIRPGL